MTTEEQLRNNIIQLVKEYYQQTHTKKEQFILGKTKVNYAGRIFDEQELCNLVDASLDFWLSYGHYSQEFEKNLSSYLQIKHTLFVNSGSSANLLAFMTLTSPLLQDRQIKRGDEVITVACAFPTTVSPIIQYGAIPVFVDVEKETANIDTTQLENAYSSKTKAVMIAHTLGNPFNIHAVLDFCNKHNLWLIEDNCDSLGSIYDGKLTGTWGDIGTSSFYPPHHITTGEGGAVYTNNALLYKIALSLRDWGRDCWCLSGKDNTCGSRFTKQYGNLPYGYDHKYVYSHFGYNLKATEMQAAIGCAQLKKISLFTQKRQENYKKLYDALHSIPYLSICTAYSESIPSWFGCLFTVTEQANFTRNDIVEYLEKNNIQTRNLFSGNILKHPCFESLRENKDYRIIGNLSNTDNFMNRSFWIGVAPIMTPEKLDYMIHHIVSFCSK